MVSKSDIIEHLCIFYESSVCLTIIYTPYLIFFLFPAFPGLIYLLSSVSLQAISNKDQHSISYTLSRVQMVVVEYTHDSNTDMFQVACLGFDRDVRSVM